MKTRKLRWPLLILILQSGLVVTGHACVCVSAESMKDPELVFVGTVLTRSEHTVARGTQPVAKYEFSVVSVSVGSVGRTVKIETSTSDCGAIFEIRHTYRVLAKRFSSGDTLRTSLCSGNAELRNGESTKP